MYHIIHRSLKKWIFFNNFNVVPNMFYLFIPADTGVWVASNFSTCSNPCTRLNFGTQKREVYCLTFGGKIVDNSRCDPELRPESVKECRSNECNTQWLPGVWTEVRYVNYLLLVS